MAKTVAYASGSDFTASLTAGTGMHPGGPLANPSRISEPPTGQQNALPPCWGWVIAARAFQSFPPWLLTVAPLGLGGAGATLFTAVFRLRERTSRDAESSKRSEKTQLVSAAPCVAPSRTAQVLPGR